MALLLAQCPIHATGTAHVRLLYGIHASHHRPDGIVWFGHVHHGEVRRAGVLLLVSRVGCWKKRAVWNGGFSISEKS